MGGTARQGQAQVGGLPGRRPASRRWAAGSQSPGATSRLAPSSGGASAAPPSCPGGGKAGAAGGGRAQGGAAAPGAPGRRRRRPARRMKGGRLPASSSQPSGQASSSQQHPASRQVAGGQAGSHGNEKQFGRELGKQKRGRPPLARPSLPPGQHSADHQSRLAVLSSHPQPAEAPLAAEARSQPTPAARHLACWRRRGDSRRNPGAGRSARAPRRRVPATPAACERPAWGGGGGGAGGVSERGRQHPAACLAAWRPGPPDL